ncbi:Microsomal signal peptidase subunit [Intoshia linei]|uniref:Signal peptidase complex subunit 2 n=1 Tax=Intoshia linei TaxID=1819745 RepID=A0A177B611_9BILA|nr:Microsomal signal peptidase subunit [Intoshia linei]
MNAEIIEENPINIWSSSEVKNSIDDCIVKVLNENKYQQIHFYTDVKLFFGTLAVCLMGLLCGLHYIYKMNDMKITFYTCCIGYGVSIGLYYLLGDYVEKGVVYRGTLKNTWVKVSSTLKTLKNQIILTIQQQNLKDKSIQTFNIQKSIGSVFTSDGYLVNNNLETAINIVLKKFNEN